MRTNTFSHLENLCATKRIICERRGRKIELTTPCGGTTAECESLAEAFDTYCTDPAFKDLPMVVNVRSNADEAPQASQTHEEKEFTQRIADSDKRIAEAMKVLRSHHRGQMVLTDWVALVKSYGCGLDQRGWYALQTLVNETAAGRRDYLEAL